jgi:hypothetical protein
LLEIENDTLLKTLQNYEKQLDVLKNQITKKIDTYLDIYNPTKNATAAHGSTVFSALKPNSVSFLNQLKVDQESFGTTLNNPDHRSILTQTGDIVNTTSGLGILLGDKHIYELMLSTVETCQLANELSKQGASQEAQIVAYFASALSVKVQDIGDSSEASMKEHIESAWETLQSTKYYKELEKGKASLWDHAQRIKDGEFSAIITEKMQEFESTTKAEKALILGDVLMTVVQASGKKITILPQAKTVIARAFSFIKTKGGNTLDRLKGIAQQHHPQPATAAAGTGPVPVASASAMQGNNTSSRSGSGGSAKNGQTTGKADPASAVPTKEVQWTPHGYKHVAQKNTSWKDTVKKTLGKNKPAKYKPDVVVEPLERKAWNLGTLTNDGKNNKVFDCGEIIGAHNGKETSYMIVKHSSNTIHGHPISQEEYKALLKKD